MALEDIEGFAEVAVGTERAFLDLVRLGVPRVELEDEVQAGELCWTWSRAVLETGRGAQLVVCFRNALPSAHAKWIELESRPMRANGQPIVRRILRHNAIEAWTHMQKTGWKRCQPRL